MATNGFNNSIPSILVKTNELMALTTGTTYQHAGTTSSPGALYSSYTCTHLYSSVDNDNFLSTQKDGTGANIRITLGTKGEQFAWNHTGHDIAGGADGNNVISMCYCQDPCQLPNKNALSGSTTVTRSGYQLIGGNAFDNNNL